MLGAVTLHVKRSNGGQRSVYDANINVGREGNGKPLILHIISRKSGKPAISKVATEFMWRQSRRSPCQCSRPIPYDEHKSFFEEDLKSILEGAVRWSSDLLTVLNAEYHVYRRGWPSFTRFDDYTSIFFTEMSKYCFGTLRVSPVAD